MKMIGLIGLVVAGNLAGAALSYYGSLWFAWPFAREICSWLWAMLLFPFGWWGIIENKLLSAPPQAVAVLWGSTFLNAVLWGWAAYKIKRAIQRRNEWAHRPFDASTIYPRIEQLRQHHADAAQARAHPLYSRKGLVEAARQVVAGFAYFSGMQSGHRLDEKTEQLGTEKQD